MGFSQILTPAIVAITSVAVSVASLNPAITSVAVSVAAIMPALSSIASGTSAESPVSSVDSADNVYTSDVVGNKTDTVAGTSLVSIGKQVLVSVSAFNAIVTAGLISTMTSSAAGTILTQTIASVAGQSIYLYAFGVTVSGAALTSTVIVSIIDDVTTIYKTAIGLGAPIGESRYREFAAPIKGTSGKSLTLQATTGGSSVIMIGNLVYIQR